MTSIAYLYHNRRVLGVLYHVQYLRDSIMPGRRGGTEGYPSVDYTSINRLQATYS